MLTLVPLAGAVIAFIMTEDMSNPMGMVDTWTILMVRIVAVQVVLAVLARKSTKKNKR